MELPGPVALAAVDLTFELVTVWVVDQTFISRHLVVDETAEVNGAILEDHLAQSLKDVI